jgi:hypothetical protein
LSLKIRIAVNNTIPLIFDIAIAISCNSNREIKPFESVLLCDLSAKALTEVVPRQNLIYQAPPGEGGAWKRINLRSMGKIKKCWCPLA